MNSRKQKKPPPQQAASSSPSSPASATSPPSASSSPNVSSPPAPSPASLPPDVPASPPGTPRPLSIEPNLDPNKRSRWSFASSFTELASLAGTPAVLPEELRKILEDPKRGIFLFHSRSLHRMLQNFLGLDHRIPPETPVLRMPSKDFLRIVEEEEPALYARIKATPLPPDILLVELMTNRQLRKAPAERLWWRYWSWLVVGELLKVWKERGFLAEAIRRQIGHASFESARQLLTRQRYVIHPENDEEIATTFVSWWMTLGSFAPEHRDDLFPSFPKEALDSWLEKQNLGLDEIIRRCRPDAPLEIPLRLPSPPPLRLPSWKEPFWLAFLSKEEIQTARKECQDTARDLQKPPTEASSPPKQRPLPIAFFFWLGSILLRWARVRAFGPLFCNLVFGIFRARLALQTASSPATSSEGSSNKTPATPPPSGVRKTMLHFAARHALRLRLFEYNHAFRWAIHEEGRGNEAEALIQLHEVIGIYRAFAEDKDGFLEGLYQRSAALSQQIQDRFFAAHPPAHSEDKAVFAKMLQEFITLPLDTIPGRQGAAILKTLQRSYLDKDRDFFTTHVWPWLRSAGKTPIEVPLQYHGRMRSLRYLQSAQKRISKFWAKPELREEWQEPITHAIESLEMKLRDLFGPTICEEMKAAGLQPRTVREEVSLARIKDEILDIVIQRGRFTFSDIRDIISRNELRLPDPTWKEMIFGDSLLRVNENFMRHFQDIYRSGEIYLRLLQRMSSLLFGTLVGRWLCRWLLIPFGGAVMLLVSVAVLFNPIYKFFSDPLPTETLFKSASGLLYGTGGLSPSALAAQIGLASRPAEVFFHKPELHLLSTASILLSGGILLGIIHTQTGREIAKLLLQGIRQGIPFLFVEFPKRLLKTQPIQFILKHPRSFLIYRYALLPVFFGALFAFGLNFFLRGVYGIWDWFVRDSDFLPSPPLWLRDHSVVWNVLTFAGWITVLYLLLNTPWGRAIWDWFAYRFLNLWQQLRDRLLIGLIKALQDFFQILVINLDYLIYRVDDLLRFHKDESRRVIAVKATIQVLWFGLTYFFRMMINLVIEPQVNPIKHFPTVTVSHKLLIPFSLLVGQAMSNAGYPKWLSWVVALLGIQFVFPGIAGFLVWELKENWKLFRANQSKDPAPVRVGSHGETIEALLRRGFHSGTIPKLYDKLYKLAQKEYVASDPAKRAHLRHEIEHVQDGLVLFLERELFSAFRLHPLLAKEKWNYEAGPPTVGRNHIDLFFSMKKSESSHTFAWSLRFEIEGGRLIADLRSLSPAPEKPLTLEEIEAFDSDLAFFLQKAGIRFVRRKLEEQLSFYLRNLRVGIPGSLNEPPYAVYWIEREKIRVQVSSIGAKVDALYYELDDDGRLYEPAPLVALEEGDPILPRSSAVS